MKTFLSLAFCALLVTAASAQTTPAAKPPMGWNSWNHFAGRVTDADMRSAADQLVSTGMRDAGYIYVNLDDTWQGTRDAQGVIHGNDRFPDMKALADYIHSKGLKFGIYSSPGTKTCAGFEGSYGHEVQDAKTYAAWGVDYLKYDLCSMQDDMRKAKAEHPDDPGFEYRMMRAAYKKMGDALKATGRPIIYSLCQYGMDEPWKWGQSVGAQLWRTTDDTDDTYNRMINIAQSQATIAQYAGPGHWNDPDMLEVGNGGMSHEEYKTHMSLWAMLAAPLLAGNDLSKMQPSDKYVLMHRQVIAIDQDAMGKAAKRVLQQGDFSVWTRPLTGGRTAVAIVNGAGDQRDFALDMASAGLAKDMPFKEVWSGKSESARNGVLNVTVPKHGTLLFISER